MIKHMTFQLSNAIQQDFKKTCKLSGTSMSIELRKFVMDYITRQSLIFERFQVRSKSIDQYENKVLNKGNGRWEDSYE